MSRLVIDVGGTWTRVGRAEGKKLVSHRVFKTPRQWRVARQAFVLATGELFRGCKVKDVVIGLPGMFDGHRSILRRAPNLRGWEIYPIKRDLERIFQATVRLENDAALGALGEATHGAGRGFAIVGYLTVGTGVGGARVVDQRIDRAGNSFEPGQKIVDAGHTLEQQIGGRSLAKRYRSQWPRLSVSQWNTVTKQLANGLTSLAVRWSPDIFVLGGSVVLKGKIRFDHLRPFLRQKLQSEPPKIRRSKLGDLSGLWGGAVSQAE